MGPLIILPCHAIYSYWLIGCFSEPFLSSFGHLQYWLYKYIQVVCALGDSVQSRLNTMVKARESLVFFLKAKSSETQAQLVGAHTLQIDWILWPEWIWMDSKVDTKELQHQLRHRHLAEFSAMEANQILLTYLDIDMDQTCCMIFSATSLVDLWSGPPIGTWRRLPSPDAKHKVHAVRSWWSDELSHGQVMKWSTVHVRDVQRCTFICWICWIIRTDVSESAQKAELCTANCLGQDGCNADLTEAVVVVRFGQAGLAHGNAHSKAITFWLLSAVFIGVHHSLSRSFTPSMRTKNQTPLQTQQKW